MVCTAFNPNAIRSEFPLLTREVNGHPLVYLDNAATTQKPRAVVEAVEAVYTHYNANIHRGVHTLSQEATQAYEEARTAAAQHIGAPERESVIFTSGATAGLNLLANLLTDRYLHEGDTVLVSEMEHHSDLVPWQLNAPRKGAKVVKIPITDDGALDLEQLQALLHRECVKIVAVAHVSNVLGRVNPVAEIARMGHAHGALVVVDGAQGVKHGRVDVQELGADFYAFSGHKIYGPTGVGVLWGRRELLEALPPWMGGGEMVGTVSFEGTTYADLPFRLEAGTPPYIQAIGLGRALQFYHECNPLAVSEHENRLMRRGYEGISQIKGLRVLGYSPDNAGILSVTHPKIHHYDLGVLLDRMGIAVRTGTHCAEPLMARFGITGTLRASFALYNTEAEVDTLIAGLERAVGMLA
ncbi:MAG: aminotransferase class V-fold PLP-dependent enzyme [Bacteroides sp.]